MTRDSFDPETHLGDVMEQAAKRFGDREALVFGGLRLTFRQCDDLVNTLVAQLEELGLNKGDRLALILPPLAEIPLLALAAAKLGAITVPINPTLQPGEIAFILKDTSASIVAMVPQMMGRDNLRMLEEARHDLPELRHVLVKGAKPEGMLSLDEMLAAPQPAPRPTFVRPGLSPHDTLFIFFTGGTTGLPKGVMCNSYRYLYTHAENLQRWSDKDAMLMIAPLYMTAGFVWMAPCFMFGMKLVGLPAFDPRVILQTIQDEKITYTFFYPTMMRMILSLPTFDQYDLSSMRMMATGGEPVTSEMIRTVQEKFGCRVHIGYGMTESTAVANTERLSSDELLSSTDGAPFPGIELKIVDGERKEVPLGEVGEIAIRGKPVFDGYWNRPELNAQVKDADGWFYTGDSARFINDQGYIRVVGRLKDTIRRGAMTVYPEEVENHLKTHPKIANAGVIGVPSPVAGQRVRAYVQLHPGQQMTPTEVAEHCRSALASYKLPDEVRFVEALPLSSVRRIQRWKLREEAQRESEQGTP